jgi:lipoprotein-anchoring transpeptidase ErfK/SrfK
VPKEQLDYGAKYTATVTTTVNGQAKTNSVEFTTMAAPTGRTAGVHSATGDNQVLGLAAPIVLTLDHAVAKADQAAFEKRLSVTSTPAQVGSWSWITDREVHFRPQVHWQPGTKLFVDAKTGGLPIGGGFYSRNDLTITTSIATNGIEITVDDKVHKLYVYQGGKLIKTMPASNGKASTPSSSGAFVIMSRMPSEIFDSSLGTGGIPVGAPGAYREKVLWTERLTWGGEYIHAAPWSVADQGHRDVSHGCTNVSTDNAKWIFDHSHVGDPVTVKNTPRHVTYGNGWTDWDVSFDKYKQGSALS